MTTERNAWASLHPLETARPARHETCVCGQELDSCHGHHHCPRCGTSIAARAA